MTTRGREHYSLLRPLPQHAAPVMTFERVRPLATSDCMEALTLRAKRRARWPQKGKMLGLGQQEEIESFE